jgi:23S rRNA pseudouridine2605 synthase
MDNQNNENNPEKGERIAKVMARAGLCSRRDAETWINAGRVSVNGSVLESPAYNVRPGDYVMVDGEPLPRAEATRLFMYHKPAGYVTTARDELGRETVFDILPEGLPRVISVGRLDLNTEGLLLLTNDGGLSRFLELPATGWVRTYRVRAYGTITQERLDTLRDGITIDGVRYGSIQASFDHQIGANCWLVFSITEGKNREVRRVLEYMGLTVNRLIRVSYGPFNLGEMGENEVVEVRAQDLHRQIPGYFSKK